MEFVIWACRVIHILSAAVLLGGMVYYNAVLTPIVEYEKATAIGWMRAVDQRFQGFIWTTVWPLLVTGILLLLMQPNLADLALADPWTQLMAVKAGSFVLLVFFSWQMGVVVRHMAVSIGEDREAFEGWHRAYGTLMKRSIVSALAAVLATGALGIV